MHAQHAQLSDSCIRLPFRTRTTNSSSYTQLTQYRPDTQPPRTASSGPHAPPSQPHFQPHHAIELSRVVSPVAAVTRACCVLAGSVHRPLKLRLVGKVTNGDLPLLELLLLLEELLLLLLRDTCTKGAKAQGAAHEDVASTGTRIPTGSTCKTSGHSMSCFPGPLLSAAHPVKIRTVRR